MNTQKLLDYTKQKIQEHQCHKTYAEIYQNFVRIYRETPHGFSNGVFCKTTKHVDDFLEVVSVDIQKQYQKQFNLELLLQEDY